MVGWVFSEDVRAVIRGWKGEVCGLVERLWKVSEKLGGGVRRLVRSKVWLNGMVWVADGSASEGAELALRGSTKG